MATFLTCPHCGYPEREHASTGWGDNQEPVCIEEPKPGYPIRPSGAAILEEDPF